ncbi:MAG: family 20 glycosylhydrolase, partial [Lentisphaerae bacterium]|nr:family 20 glycosylhydrolase [Lentisphaerota bacterium]
MLKELFPLGVNKLVPGKFFCGEVEYFLSSEMGDGFSIDAVEDRCVVKGGDNGLLYAGDLLRDIFRQDGGIACGSYHDEPDISLRCYHLDLKKGTGGMPDIRRTMERLRTLRYNYILMEYENRIRLDALPGVDAPDAFGHDEIREIIHIANENGIKVIPLVQSFGHLEYLLRLPEYRKYSECPDQFSQLCPLNEAAYELWRKVFDEVATLHHDSEYFHIGGDEVRNLGKCPDCARFVADSSREELFFKHIDRVCRYASAKGFRPVLWHDMLARAKRFDLISRLPQETVLLYWSYLPENLEVNHIQMRETIMISRKWLDKINSPADFQDAPQFFTDFIENAPADVYECCRRTVGANPGDDLTVVPELPLLEPMKRCGLEVWGASVLAPSAYNAVFGDPLRTWSNMQLWVRAGVNGMVMTRWAGSNSLDAARGPLSVRDLSLAQGGLLMWKKSLSIPEIEKRYDASFGKNAASLSRMISVMTFSEKEWYMNWAEHLDAEFQLLEKDIIPEMMWLYQKFRVAMRSEHLIRRLTSFVRNSAGQMAGDAYGNSLKGEIMLMKELLREHL